MRWKSGADAGSSVITAYLDKSSAAFITKSCQGPVGQLIPWQDKTKYVSIFIDKNLSFFPHINHTVAKTNGIKDVLVPLHRQTQQDVDQKQTSSLSNNNSP